MRYSIIKSKNIKGIFLAFAIFFGNFINSLAQSPTHYPSGNDPVDFTLVNILVYIVAPILMVIIYLWYRRYLYKKKQSEKE
jgi:zinc transporter ZupT